MSRLCLHLARVQRRRASITSMLVSLGSAAAGTGQRPASRASVAGCGCMPPRVRQYHTISCRYEWPNRPWATRKASILWAVLACRKIFHGEEPASRASIVTSLSRGLCACRQSSAAKSQHREYQLLVLRASTQRMAGITSISSGTREGPAKCCRADLNQIEIASKWPASEASAAH